VEVGAPLENRAYVYRYGRPGRSEQLFEIE
jgi:hypothetical protein